MQGQRESDNWATTCHKVLAATRKYSLPLPQRRLRGMVTGRLLACHRLPNRWTGHLCARPAPIANLDHGAIATDGEALHTATALRRRGWNCGLCQDGPRSRSRSLHPTLLLAAGTRANHWARRAHFVTSVFCAIGWLFVMQGEAAHIPGQHNGVTV